MAGGSGLHVAMGVLPTRSPDPWRSASGGGRPPRRIEPAASSPRETPSSKAWSGSRRRFALHLAAMADDGEPIPEEHEKPLLLTVTVPA
jgi:hypothetical protein